MKSLCAWLRATCLVLAGGLWCSWASASWVVDWAPEPAGGLDPHQPTAVAARAWAPLPTARLNAGSVDRAHWIRLRTEARAGVSIDRLVIDNPLLDEVRIHRVSGPQAGREIVFGAARPLVGRPVKATQILVPISLQPGEAPEVLIWGGSLSPSGGAGAAAARGRTIGTGLPPGR